MFDDVLERIRQNFRDQQYIVTLHADEEMDDDNLCLNDLERAINTGQILERQRDKNTGEWKYRICGLSIEGDSIEIIAKLGVTGKVVIITVYAC